MNKWDQERFVANLKASKKLKEWKMFYNVFVPQHCKTFHHPWGTFEKYLKYHVVNLYE